MAFVRRLELMGQTIKFMIPPEGLEKTFDFVLVIFWLLVVDKKQQTMYYQSFSKSSLPKKYAKTSAESFYLTV